MTARRFTFDPLDDDAALDAIAAEPDPHAAAALTIVLARRRNRARRKAALRVVDGDRVPGRRVTGGRGSQATDDGGGR
jgi:hypothetical protein